MKKFLILKIVIILVCLFVLSQCNCESYPTGTLRVRLLDPPSVESYFIHFDVTSDKDEIVAAGVFSTADSDPSALAKKDGKTYEFHTSAYTYDWDVFIYIDVNEDSIYSTGDKECNVVGVYIDGYTLLEINYYTDFTEVTP